MLVLTVSKLF